MSMSKNGREPLYVVRNSEIHGRGVFALRRIRKGTRILEYTGERITNKEADRRYDDDKMKRHH
jgi:SET domain-containing protein